MLELLHGSSPVQCENERIRMGDAAWPAPFLPGLEYNSPAHGTWNIVHTGMLIPDSHQIYVCAANCNRGVILTAAEMNAVDRFSSIVIQEENLINGDMEELVIEGVTEILLKLERKPSVVLLFTVCIHHFMGCDLGYIYSTLRERFPGQCFVDCYMDPIMQKGGMTPDEKLRIRLYAPLVKRKKNRRQINIIGNDLPTDPDSDILAFIKESGYEVKDITSCNDFEEYLSMAESFLNITSYPSAKKGGDILSKRLEMEHLYMPQSFSYEELDAQFFRLADILGTNPPETAQLKKKCEMSLEKAKEQIGDTRISIDASAVPRILGLTRLLLSHGLRVFRIYTDGFSPEEEGDYHWLREHYPDLEVCATIHPGMRIFPRKFQEKILAIGQKAAYFSQTPYFVNMVEGGGLFGYSAICRLAERMCEAFFEEKDTKDLIVRKGLGCESCI